MLFIHHSSFISPQSTFSHININILKESSDNKLLVFEPLYEGIPPGVLRRMGKAVRIGVGACLPLLKLEKAIKGIIIGTGDGGMEDCIKFLNQIIQYEEGTLTPTNFVQSTPNAIASQLAMLSSNTSYNITHVHRGLAFENALLDAFMQVKEDADHYYLVGGVDEISAYNYNIDFLSGAYKEEAISNTNLYENNSPGTIAGEGSAMFMVSGHPKEARFKIEALDFFHSTDSNVVKNRVKGLLNWGEIDLLLSGENGDNRFQEYYNMVEETVGINVCVARFKHMTGEYKTASSAALWIACHLLENNDAPLHLIKRGIFKKEIGKVLIYNSYKGLQHSFILVSKA